MACEVGLFECGLPYTLWPSRSRCALIWLVPYCPPPV